MIILPTLPDSKRLRNLSSNCLGRLQQLNWKVSIEVFDGEDQDEVGFHLQGLRWQQNGYDNQNEKDVYKFILLHNQI